MYVQRIMERTVRNLIEGFPCIAVTGARQSGKTTFVRRLFPEKAYVSLEDPDQREFAENDPRGFLDRFPDGAVLDEAQRTPRLFSYLQ
ncbi:MAG: AAA family ATPase, partial [Candidatus Methanomethylophilaceae archaeon]|nr:AAA family ATPase [Candidatus Methanomethylophilaceae archaeon]